MDVDDPPTTAYAVRKEEELRVSVPESVEIKLKMERGGQAEIFGTELAEEKEYTLHGPLHFGVFTWRGNTKIVFLKK